jgi:hypothetical protein
MRNWFIVLLIFFHIQSYTQASWDTHFAFILRDENHQPIHLDDFKDSYKIINVFGDTLSNDALDQCLDYDEKNHYFILRLITIGPRFSFDLHHNDEIMSIYLPFKNENKKYYAVDFNFTPGTYLFDFEIKHQKTIYFNNNIPFYLIERINWKKQSKHFKICLPWNWW